MTDAATTPISLAIETSCRLGGVAMGRGDRLARRIDFDARSRHATHLVARMNELLEQEGLAPGDVQELYVSAGPGSFTGVRVGVTVGRTLGQILPQVRLVAVPSTLAVAENAAQLEWEHLAVILDAREKAIYAKLFRREEGLPVPFGQPLLGSPEEFLTAAPRPILLTGEGLGYHTVEGEGISAAEASLHLPTAEGVWRVGRRMSKRRAFVDANHLLPIYTRAPKALRVWEAANPQGQSDKSPG